MGKNERIRRMKKEGMHEIKNKYRVRAVNKKKKGLVMTAKKKRRALKAGASLSAIFVLILGVFAIGSAFLSSVVPNVVPDDFVTVSYELPTDGSNPADHSALENIGYMNYRFKNQNGWYAEMHGTTTSMGIAQSVNTIKQYSDGVLIMADVTSGFANAGRQFCYVGDEVMWRELPKNSSYKMDSFEDMLALTFNDELEAHMTIPAFKEKNGLPGTEMSVYIINEDTLDRADPVELVTTGEWDDKDFAEKPVYRQTYYLRPGDSEHLGAAAHYANQMAFTGGLTGLPEFNYITVTYTFDSSWQILRAEINEAYKAQMGITVNCTSDFKTDYEYGTDRAYNSVYESYYKDLVGVGIDDNVEKPLDSTALLISSFLTKPVTFEVELEIDGKKTSGIISLDASKLDLEAIMESGSPDIAAALGGVGLKAQIGDIFIYLEDSTAYISVHDLKAKLPIDKLLTLIGGANAAPEEPEAEEPPKVEEPAKTEGAEEKPQAPVFGIDDPVLSEDGASASVHAEINLTSLGVKLVVPIDFKFDLDEEKNATLNSLDLSAEYQGINAKVSVKDTQKTVADLTDKESYIDLYPYVDAVYKLVAGKKLDIGFGYANGDMALTGNIGIDFINGLTAAGELTLQVGEASKTVAFSLAGGVAYVNLDGIKLAVPINDAVALIKGFLPATSATEGGAAGGTSQIKSIVDKALSAVFDNDLAALFTLSEEDNALSVGLKGTDLLKLFGVNFDLGDVNLSIDGASGAVRANACGAEITLKAGQGVSVDTEGYTDILPYADALVKLFESKTFTVDVSYEAANVAGKALSVNGSVTLGLSPLAASGEINVAYGTVQTTVGIVYDADGYLYLTLDSVEMKANVSDAIKMIASLVSPDAESTPAGNETKTEIYATLEKALALNFGELIEISETKEEGNATLVAAIDGSKLLNLFGVNFNLGEVVLTVGADGVTASAIGVNLTLAGGGEVETVAEADKAAYVDLKPVLDALPDLLEKKAVSLVGSVVLTADGKDYALFVNRAIVNFADGIEAYIDASLVMTEATIDLQLYIDTTGVKLSIGGFGAELKFSDFASIGDAVVALYADVRETVNPVFGKELLPEAKTIGDLLNLLSSLLSADKEGGKGGLDFSLDSVLAGLSVKNSDEKDGLFALQIMGFTLDIVNEKDGFVGAMVNFAGGGLQVAGDFSVASYAPATPESPVIPAMPEADYLDKNDFIDLLDYLAATLNTITSDQFSVDFRAELPAQTDEGVQYQNVLAGTAEYVKGGGQAFNVYNSETKKSVVVSPELYLHVGVSYTDNGAAGSNLYVDAYIFNYKKSEEDETLDFFVTLSKYTDGETGYHPLKLYASADELMSLLSVAVSALGIDNGILNDFIVSNWLDLQTVADLKALGSSLLETIGIGDIKSLFGSAATANERETDSFLKLIDFAQPDENGVSTLTIEWKGGKAAISKQTADDGKNYLTGFDLAIGDTAVGVTLDAHTEVKKADVALDESYFKLEGIAKLLSLVATSVTHPTTTTDENGNTVYGSELNKLIYMNGQINLGISSSVLKDCVLTINVDSVAVVFEEDGVAVNVRFSYKALTVKAVGMVDVVAINGDSVVDLTGKNGMVYIKRTTTSKGETKLDEPEVLYRAMPLSNFLSDLINQVGFLFNLGSTITDLLAKVGGGDSSGSGSPLTINDIGDIADLISCTYTENKDGTRGYVLQLHLNKLKIDSLTLGNLYVTVDTMINEKGEEVVRNLGIRGDDEEAPLLEAVKLITLTLNEGTSFTLRNPRGAVDKEIQKTYEGTWKHDLETELSEGMKYRLSGLEASKWEGVPFIEGKLTTLSYVINTARGTEVIKTQSIVVSTGAKDGNGNVIDPAGTVYADFSINSYPSLEGYDNVPGYTPQWTKIYTQSDSLPADMTVVAAYVANEYRNLTLVSEYEIEGFTKVGDVWEKTYNYLYGSALPVASNEAYRLVGYCDGNGKTVSASEILSDDMRLYAKWVPVEYEIYSIVDGVETRTTAHYGDKLSEILPVPEKDGYEFSHWSLNVGGEAAETVTGNADFYAVFTPKTYEIVLKSNYALTGFVADGNGGYIRTIDYVYGSETALPVGEFDTVVNGVSKAMFLDGFTETEGGELLTALSGIARNTTLTAVWSEVKHKVQYVADGGAVTSQNYNDGDIIKLPAVPEKFGYRGEWKLSGEAISGDYRVYGDLEIRAEYVAIEYTFKLVSSERTPGYREEGGVYVDTYKYTFGGAPVGLSSPEDALGYFFGGFYTRENGGGKKVESLTSELVESLAYSISDNEIKLYVYWKDNAVTVRYYSDVMFAYEGEVSTMEAQGAYYIDVKYRNQYSIEAYAPKIKGYQQLGWWVKSGTSWAQVTDVLEFYGKGAVTDADNRPLADVALWAVWIKDIKVTLTGFYTNDYWGGQRYNIKGEVEGGYAVQGRSAEIFAALGMQEEMKAILDIVGAKSTDKYGNLGWGGTLTLTDSKDKPGVKEFASLDSDCYNYAGGWGRPLATYGGAIILKTFSYGDMKIETYSAAFVSLATYSVTYRNAVGGDVTVDNVRIACPFAYVKDGRVYTFEQSIVYADELAAKKGIAAPQADGAIDEYHTFAWPHTPINGNTTISAVPIPNLYAVRFESRTEIEGFTYDEERGIYYMDARVRYGETVTLVHRGERLAPFTVSADAKKNVFDLSLKIANIAGASVMPFSVSEDGYSFEIEVQSNPDYVKLSSDVAFVYDGKLVTETTVSFDTEFVLPQGDQMIANGYTFVGWFEQQADGSWVQVTEFTYAGGANTKTVEAVWVRNLGIEITDASRSGGGTFSKSTYAATVSVSGFEVIGKPVTGGNALSVSYDSFSFVYFVNNDGATGKDYTVKTNNFTNQYVSADSFSGSKQSKKDYMNVELTAKVTVGGIAITQTVHEYYKY